MPPLDLAAPIQSPPGFHSPVMLSPTSLHPGVHAELTQVMPGESFKVMEFLSPQELVGKFERKKKNLKYICMLFVELH